MSEFIKLIRREVETDDPEYLVNVLDHQYAKEGFSWRLDWGCGHWIYLRWDESSLVAYENIILKDSEVLGFLKARFPQLNIRRELADAAVGRLKGKIKKINEAMEND